MSWIEGTQNRPPPRFRSNGELAKIEGFLEEHEAKLALYEFLRNNINEFYCVDIPHFLLFQEYFIMSSILEKNIQKKFIFCPSNEINLIIKKQFKIFLNKDSLPEIDGIDSKIYYDIISKNKGAFFFSINHESTSKNQKSVSENLLIFHLTYFQ